MRDVFLAMICLSYLFTGLVAPFTAGLGYIWIDLISPQNLGWSFIKGLSLSFYLGAATLFLYLITDRKDPPRFGLSLILLSLWAIWVTLTTTWSVVPGPAWVKWDWAFKVICFSIFVPFIIRSRVQIEAMLLTIVFAMSGITIAFGAKSILTGGGYGHDLGLAEGNSGLTEGSGLALTASAIVPLLIFFARHSRILPRHPLVTVMVYSLIVAAIATAVGTHARTGLVALVVLGALLWLTSRRKVVLGVAIMALVSVGSLLTTDRWLDRMTTIQGYQQDHSAMSRIAVWSWTLEFVSENPFGGGFGSYRINQFVIPAPEMPGGQLEIRARAFHSIYFEVLGEHGYVGAAIYGLIIVAMFANFRRVATAKDESPEALWSAGLSRALTISALVYLAGGAFIGIAFQPFLYYLVAASISMRELVHREQLKAHNGKQSVDMEEHSASPARL